MEKKLKKYFSKKIISIQYDGWLMRASCFFNFWRLLGLAEYAPQNRRFKAVF